MTFALEPQHHDHGGDGNEERKLTRARDHWSHNPSDAPAHHSISSKSTHTRKILAYMCVVISARVLPVNDKALQPTGIPHARVWEELEELIQDDVRTDSGKVLGGLYLPDVDSQALTAAVYQRFLGANALFVNLYPSIARMEREVVRSVADLLSGDHRVAGNVTSGGTESILLAVKATRDQARERRPELVHDVTPQIVLPITAHPAFHKAAHYLGLEVVVTGVDATGFRADVDAMRAAITDRTILVVASAPNFSHGTIDPIEAIAAVAREHRLAFHVDCCVGGMILPFQRALGDPIPPFDFAVAGVTSISADLHKYGYAPKNASVVLYKNRELRRHAYFVSSATTEYAVINPTVQSSRTGGPIAAAWALMRALGVEGYERLTRSTLDATRALISGVGEIDGLEVLAGPESVMVTLASDRINVFELGDAMERRGWSLVPQFALGGSPRNLHISMTPANVEVVDALLEDLAGCTRQLLEDGSAIDEAALTAAVAGVADKSAPEIMMTLAPMLGLTGGIPSELATLNTAMNLITPDKRDALLTMYMNAM
jgi:glutamate/tyrosine decarboxylase-like PLP-dependent enzyme